MRPEGQAALLLRRVCGWNDYDVAQNYALVNLSIFKDKDTQGRVRSGSSHTDEIQRPAARVHDAQIRSAHAMCSCFVPAIVEGHRVPVVYERIRLLSQRHP